ncbi:MAG: beta-propeller domain-containing protein, partial [Candidatus Aenigmarchaeota archaeon]|nr:beta-propeller domain-containing protein [Candidatus Aenigmarchaeota archaeon]
MRKRKGILGIAGILVLIAVIGSIGAAILNVPTGKQMNTFKSCDEMINIFSKSIESQQKTWMARGFGEVQMLGEATDMAAAPTAAPEAGGAEYSETNVQVEGVDEADIVKTDGTYIYTISQGQRYYYYREDGKEDTNSKLVIAKAYPGEDAEILSETDFGDFYPNEIFIHGDRLLVFGTTYEEIGGAEPVPQVDVAQAEMMIASYPYPQRMSLMTIQLWDISDR